MRSVLRLCALVRGVAKPPSVPSFPSPVQIIQNNAVREKREGVDAGLGGRESVRGAGAGSHDALLYVLVLVSGVVILYTKSDKNIMHSTTTRLK